MTAVYLVLVLSLVGFAVSVLRLALWMSSQRAARPAGRSVLQSRRPAVAGPRYRRLPH
jgi:hypothetical protein